MESLRTKRVLVLLCKGESTAQWATQYVSHCKMRAIVMEKSRLRTEEVVVQEGYGGRHKSNDRNVFPELEGLCIAQFTIEYNC